jgi:hypothetical protein
VTEALRTRFDRITLRFQGLDCQLILACVETSRIGRVVQKRKERGNHPGWRSDHLNPFPASEGAVPR